MTTRRDFLKASLAAGAGSRTEQLTTLLHASAQAATPAAPQEWRNRQPEMGYRRLGRTGFMISEIVCGGDPISPTNNRHVELAIDMGLNYLDTAPGYHDGQSEMGYAKVVEGSKRDRVFLTTKVSPFCPTRIDTYRKIFPALSAAEQEAVLHEANEDMERRGASLPNYLGGYFDAQYREALGSAIANVMEKKYGNQVDRRSIYMKAIFDSVEGSLQRLKTDHVDLLMCPHAATSAAEAQIPEIFQAYEKLRQQGKVRFLGVTAHTDPAGVLKAAIDSGVYSSAMVAFNIVNRRYLEPIVEEAHRRDFGVIAMKVARCVYDIDDPKRPMPERGALLQSLVPGEMPLPVKAYRYMLKNQNLSAVISCMWNDDMVKENLGSVRSSPRPPA
jgi:aryl-alcohol dehydrogenase-like predicted oxidoreductase